MKTAVVYYSFSGCTRQVAAQLAKERGADLFEIKEAKPRSVPGAYLRGCLQAMRRQEVAIQPLDADLSAYDSFLLAAPIWAGSPAPAFNSALKLLPGHCRVELILTSASGDSSRSKQKTIAKAEAAGFQVTGYRDVETRKMEKDV